MIEKPVLIRGARLIDPITGLDEVGDLLIQDGTIAGLTEVSGQLEAPPGAYVVEASGWVACPGFIDLHCHLREPGFEHKETIETGTLAAARGGFTTVCAMPNTEPPIDNIGMVDLIFHRAKATAHVRVYPIGCVTRKRDGNHLAELHELADAGVVAFSDDGNPVGDPALMRAALLYGRDLGIPIINHCEDWALSGRGVVNEGWVSTRLGLPGYPAAAEESMVARDIALAALTGGRLHLAHVTTKAAMDMVRGAKERGLSVTAEVTPHHLTMSEEWVLGSPVLSDPSKPLSALAYDSRTKVNPPLRTRYDMGALIEGLREGVIDAVATDHAPHARIDKEVTYEEASMGISVLETALGSLIGLVDRQEIDLLTLVRRLTVGPAQVLGGRFSDLATLRLGTPADVVVFDPKERWRVDVAEFASKGRNTPLDNHPVVGKVKLTLVAGRIAYNENAKAREMV